MLRTCSILVLALTAAAPAARADETVDQSTSGPAPRRVNVGFSPLTAVLVPMAEINGELKLKDKISTGLVVSAGTFNVDQRDMAGDWSSDRVLCLSGGLQGRYYLWGAFERGLFAGAELFYIWLDRDPKSSVATSHEGLWFGPLVGYKYGFDFGLTLTAQVNIAAELYKRDGVDEDEVPGGATEDSGPPTIGKVLIGPNLFVGWAF